jgi:hypothetical protein
MDVTLMMVDNFDDEDNVADNKWGQWFQPVMEPNATEVQTFSPFPDLTARALGWTIRWTVVNGLFATCSRL